MPQVRIMKIALILRGTSDLKMCYYRLNVSYEHWYNDIVINIYPVSWKREYGGRITCFFCWYTKMVEIHYPPSVGGITVIWRSPEMGTHTPSGLEWITWLVAWINEQINILLNYITVAPESLFNFFSRFRNWDRSWKTFTGLIKWSSNLEHDCFLCIKTSWGQSMEAHGSRWGARKARALESNMGSHYSKLMIYKSYIYIVACHFFFLPNYGEVGEERLKYGKSYGWDIWTRTTWSSLADRVVTLYRSHDKIYATVLGILEKKNTNLRHSSEYPTMGVKILGQDLPHHAYFVETITHREEPFDLEKEDKTLTQSSLNPRRVAYKGFTYVMMTCRNPAHPSPSHLSWQPPDLARRILCSFVIRRRDIGTN